MTTIRLFFLTIFSLSSALSVQAEGEDKWADSIRGRFDEAVVKAARIDLRPDMSPQRVVSISPEDISLRQPQTAADLLGLSGHVYIQKSQQGGGSPMIRGFAAHRLLYAVDGVRMNTAIFRSGNLQNVISLDPFALESAEVRLGPGSVLYGSDAIGGVMAFNTLTPALSDSVFLVKGKAAVRHSTANNERTAHFDINLAKGKWSWLGSVTHFDYDDLKQGSHGPAEYLKPWIVRTDDKGVDHVLPNPNPRKQSPSGYDQWNVMQKLRFRPNQRLDLQYGFHYSQTSPYGRYDRHSRLRKGRPRYAEWDYGPQIWHKHQLDVEWVDFTLFYDVLRARAAYQYFEESRIDRTLDKPLRTTQRERVGAASVNIDFSKQFKHSALYYGIEVVSNKVKSDAHTTHILSGETAPAPARYPKSEWFSGAIYAQLVHRVRENWDLEFGLRYNHDSLKADFQNYGIAVPFPSRQGKLNQAISGGLGTAYRPNKDSRLSFYYSRAFRGPNVDDMGKLFDSIEGGVMMPNPGLHPEYAHHLELGWEHRPMPWLHYSLNLFYTYLDDAMVRRPYRWNGRDSIVYKGELHEVLALQNAAWAHVAGAQFHAEAKLPHGFSISTHLNLQDGREQMDNGTTSPLRHAAPFFGTAALSYRRGALHAMLYTDFQARRSADDIAIDERGKTEIYALDADGRPYAPGWMTLNLKATYALPRGGMLHLGLENMTNLRYRLYSSGLSAAGRNFVCGLTWRF